MRTYVSGIIFPNLCTKVVLIWFDSFLSVQHTASLRLGSVTVAVRKHVWKRNSYWQWNAHLCFRPRSDWWVRKIAIREKMKTRCFGERPVRIRWVREEGSKTCGAGSRRVWRVRVRARVWDDFVSLRRTSRMRAKRDDGRGARRKCKRMSEWREGGRFGRCIVTEFTNVYCRHPKEGLLATANNKYWFVRFLHDAYASKYRTSCRTKLFGIYLSVKFFVLSRFFIVPADPSGRFETARATNAPLRLKDAVSPSRKRDLRVQPETYAFKVPSRTLRCLLLFSRCSFAHLLYLILKR